MRISERGAFWLDILIFSGISIFMYEIGILSFLFLVPLQIAAKKRGETAYLFSALVVLTAVLVTAIIETRSVENTELKYILILLQIVTPIMLAASLYIVNRRYPQVWRNLYKLLGVTLAVGLGSVPIILIIKQNGTFVVFLREQLTALFAVLAEAFAISGSGLEAGLIGSLIQPSQILETIKAVFFRNFLFSFFIALVLNWRIGLGIARRVVGSDIPALVRFHMPEKFIWILLISWAGILGDIFFGLKVLGYIVWNIGLISMFLYGLQGWGIVRFLLGKSNLPQGMQSFFTVLIVVLLIIPGINILIILGIPIFGVSETWIHFRKPKRSDES